MKQRRCMHGDWLSGQLFSATVIGAGTLYWLLWVMGATEVQGKHAINLKMGSIKDDNIQDKHHQHWSFIRRPKEVVAACTSEKVPAFVDTFYNLVTNIYE